MTAPRIELVPLSQSISFRLNDDDCKILNAAAKDQGVDRSELLRRTIRAYLEETYSSKTLVPTGRIQPVSKLQVQSSNKYSKKSLMSLS
jgi:metal-responsive CopG/Arc/MetJ family transcriptional regulator